MSKNTMLDNLMQRAGGGSVTDMGNAYQVKGSGLAIATMLAACIRALMKDAKLTAMEIAEIVAASVARAEEELARKAGRPVQ